MSPETKQKIQLILAAGIAIAAIRTGYIFYERKQDNAAPVKQEAAPLKSDYYVTPKKLHPYDLQSARELTQQPAWVRDGYRFAYYPYNAASKRTDFAHESGTLGPIEKLDIKDVVTDTPPGKSGGQQVMAVFQKRAGLTPSLSDLNKAALSPFTPTISCSSRTRVNSTSIGHPISGMQLPNTKSGTA